MNYTVKHASVLVHEVVEHLIMHKNMTYIDATFGNGGHTKALLKYDPSCSVIGIDWDKAVIEQFTPLMEEAYGTRCRLIWGNFAHLYKLIKKGEKETIGGILADFGTSQMQIHEKDGFSFMHNTPLDMRMSSSHFGQTAADVVNTFSEYELRKLLWDYGQERYAAKIAHAILFARHKKKIKTTTQLVEVVLSVVPWSKKGVHPATKTFQALRIFVNKELENIHAFLIGAFALLPSGARLACISFHSLEDEKVKHFFKEKEQLGVAKVITKKAVIPSEEEIKQNSSSRSAKLRVVEKL